MVKVGAGSQRQIEIEEVEQRPLDESAEQQREHQQKRVVDLDIDPIDLRDKIGITKDPVGWNVPGANTVLVGETELPLIHTPFDPAFQGTPIQFPNGLKTPLFGDRLQPVMDTMVDAASEMMDRPQTIQDPQQHEDPQLVETPEPPDPELPTGFEHLTTELNKLDELADDPVRFNGFIKAVYGEDIADEAIESLRMKFVNDEVGLSFEGVPPADLP
ncbi:MAG: hypothetical protein AAFN74_26295, partial [Myxococcota bacterium]